MMTTHLKKFLLFLISAITLITVTVWACAGGDWSGQEGSMFTPEIINQPKHQPFFRTTAYPFYGDISYDDAGAEYFVKTNCNEWRNYFNNKISDSCVYYWLYEASLKQIDSMIFSIKSKPANLTKRSQQYSLKNNVAVDVANAFLYYVGFAKRNEEIAVKEVDYYWEEKQKKTPTVSVAKQIAGGLNFFNKASNTFIKERYAFQLIRLYFFNQEYDNAIAFYNNNETSVFKSGNSMRWRSLGYKAASLYKQKKYSESNLIYAKIYDEYEPLKRSAYLSFHPQQLDDLRKTLTLASTTHEKEILWQLQGLYTNQITAMKEMLALNPKSELVNLLLVRAVNMEEEKLNNEPYADNKKSKNEIVVDVDLLNLLNALSDENKTSNPVVCHLAAAYLNYMASHDALADMQLKRASKALGNDKLINAQYHVVSLYGKLGKVKTINAEIEKDLLPDVKSLFGEEAKANTDFRKDAAQASVRKMISDLYKNNRDYEKAELINPGCIEKYYITTSNIQKMIDYFDNPNKSDLEKVFLENAFYNKGNYQELIAIRYAQNDELEKSLSVFKSIPNFNITLYGNPFTIHIKDCHDCDHEAPQKTKYTKTSFIGKMIEMKSIAASKPNEAAQNYFLVANGFYNMTYFGNARLFYDNKVDNSIYYYNHTLVPEENSDLALKYYLLARDKSTDREFKAKCTFMAAKCEQNNFFMNKPENYQGDFKAGQYFAALKKEYSITKYYSEIIKECNYFRTYVKK